MKTNLQRKESDLVIPFTWENRRPAWLEKFFYLPAQIETHTGPLDWSTVFAEPKPLSIEYCSGNGQWIAAQAARLSQFNWIAVERDFERARKVWLKIFRQNLTNLVVVCGEALTFTTHYLAPACVEQFYVNFPDPWPKRRHFKHRLIGPAFVQQTARVIRPGGTAMLVTDDAAYSEEMIRQFAREPWTDPFFTTEWPDFGDSYFRSLWLSKERTIRFHRYTRG